MLLKVENLGFAYGTDEILDNVNFEIKEKEKLGLIGTNGAGKTTLVKIITDQLEADSGKINLGAGYSIGYLEQEIGIENDKTLRELFEEIFEDYRRKQDRLEEIAGLIEKTEGKEQESLLKEYDRIQEYLLRENAYSSDSRIKGMIKGINLTEEDLDKQFKSFSGGEKTKIKLAMTLLREPDLLILDEPTNFLDLSTLSWLETTLKHYPGAVLLISHDRYFLNQTCNGILELENNKIKRYPGNYENYLKRKTEERAQADRNYRNVLKEIERQKKIIQRYRDINSKQSSKHARSREKALEKIELPEQIKNQRTVNFFFEPKFRSGNDVLTVKDLSKNYGSETLFENIEFEIKRNDKVGIIGDNGIGKTTLFKILKKEEKKSSGQIEFGAKVKPDYYTQELSNLDELADLNLIEAIRESRIELNEGDIRNYLANFLFYGDDVFKKIGDLSGGEKARIKIAKLLLSNANFLLMDEPTNHLDMQTKEILEDVLSNYQGTLLFISHDRYFLNRLANKIFEFTPNGINVYLGNYDDYINKKSLETEDSKEIVKEQTLTKTQRQKNRKREHQLRKEIRSKRALITKLENEIEDKNNKLIELEELMSTPDFYSTDKSLETIQSYESLKQEITDLENNWEIESENLEEILEEVN